MPSNYLRDSELAPFRKVWWSLTYDFMVWVQSVTASNTSSKSGHLHQKFSRTQSLWHQNWKSKIVLSQITKIFCSFYNLPAINMSSPESWWWQKKMWKQSQLDFAKRSLSWQSLMRGQVSTPLQPRCPSEHWSPAEFLNWQGCSSQRNIVKPRALCTQRTRLGWALLLQAISTGPQAWDLIACSLF